VPSPAIPVVWRISDGRAGHDNQSAGLVEGLQRRSECRVHVLRAQPQLRSIASWLTGRYSPGISLEPPDLIIGAGRRCHADMLAARRSYGGHCIVLMRPGLPLSWFDLCLIPEHDRPPPAANVVTTRGALNRMRPGANRPDQGLLLIGGPSRHYGWDEAGLLERVRHIIAACPDLQWTVADSPRTPQSTCRLLAASLPDANYRSFHECSPGWLADALPEAGVTWVSEDSVSMVYEALAAGCRVGVLELPRRARAGRVARGIDGLIGGHYVTPFAQWRQDRELPPPPVRLQEADRCAAIITECYFGERI